MWKQVCKYDRVPHILSPLCLKFFNSFPCTLGQAQVPSHCPQRPGSPLSEFQPQSPGVPSDCVFNAPCIPATSSLPKLFPPPELLCPVPSTDYFILTLRSTQMPLPQRSHPDHTRLGKVAACGHPALLHAFQHPVSCLHNT